MPNEEWFTHYTTGRTNAPFGPAPTGDATRNTENWAAFLDGKAAHDRAAQRAAQPPASMAMSSSFGLEGLIAGPIVLYNQWSTFSSVLGSLGIQGGFGPLVATIVAFSCAVAAYDVICDRFKVVAWGAFMVWGYFIVQWAYPFSQWSGPFHFSWQIGVGAFALCWMLMFRRMA